MTDEDIERIFEERKNNPAYNTSYPLRPDDWMRYRVDGEADFSKDKRLSLYVHIPFCEHLCAFCEYTRMRIPTEELQTAYLHAIKHDIALFLRNHPHRELLGFDIGGGTPTALSISNFSYLMEIFGWATQQLHCTDDFEPSIEATFQTLTEEKARRIRDAGIGRVSLGVQSGQTYLRHIYGRVNADEAEMTETLEMLNRVGIKKVNLDFMYGLHNQSLQDIERDIALIGRLMPQQVTLYELRTNMLKSAAAQSKELLFQSYNLFYNALTGLGYSARFGQNTFSLDKNDKGLSSYLRHRMIEFAPYKGFGISAQSLSSTHISYNEGKLLSDIKTLLTNGTFNAAYTYRLPRKEMLAKYIAVSGYYGSFSLSKASSVLGENFQMAFAPALNFCKSEGLLSIKGDTIRITLQGFKNYGAVFSLFYYE